MPPAVQADNQLDSDATAKEFRVPAQRTDLVAKDSSIEASYA